MIRHHREACVLYKIYVSFVKIIWLATIRNFRTRMLNLSEDIFIPELS